jgi:tryptophan synthase alpha chain
MNRIQKLFERKDKKILSVFCTAGFPELNSLPEILLALQDSGVDMIEIGMPFSDPTADGPVIQHSNTIAIKNGMTLDVLFSQLETIRETVHIPLILMGYINPAFQYGMEKFLQKANACGIDGIIIPDLPMFEYETFFEPLYKKYAIENIFLITPQTSEARIRKIDSISNSFIYAVSTHVITGGQVAFNEHQATYFSKLRDMQLKNPLVAGFGIRDKQTFDFATSYLDGAIIGSAFIKAIEKTKDISADTKNFINEIIS